MLQQRIDEQGNREFVDSAAGQALIGEIMREEQGIALKMKQSRNQAENRQKVARAYDAYSNVSSGAVLNRGT